MTVVVQQPPVKHQVKMKDFLSWLGRQGRSPAEVMLEKAGENIGQGKPREDLAEKARQASRQKMRYVRKKIAGSDSDGRKG